MKDDRPVLPDRPGPFAQCEGRALAAGVMIGNPFTDVPELCSQVVVVAETDARFVHAETARLAEALGHTICRRPMYPLGPNATFAPEPEIFHTLRR